MPTTTNYIWDEDNLLAEADGTNAIDTVYTNEPQEHGNLVSTRIGHTTSYHHFDALGSTRQLTNAVGHDTDSMNYDAWGNVVARTGTTNIAFVWVGEFGYYYDLQTGIFWVAVRPYAPVIGRWLSDDPAGFVDGLNLRLHVANNPVNLTDPSGEIAVEVVPTPRQPRCPKRAGAVMWKFTLWEKARCNGFIVQNVSVRCRVSPCGQVGQEQTFQYWEGWRVNKDYRTNQGVWTDRASFPVDDCQIGEYEQTGEIRFYCNNSVGLPDASTVPSIPGWDSAGGADIYYPAPDSPCATTPGGLTSTQNRPAFWDSLTLGTGYAYRWFLQTWHCCPKKKPCCGDGTTEAKMAHSP